MISLDLTRQAPPADRSKLHLVKGREISLCHHCKKSMSRKSLLRCNECRHDFCPNCLDACRCYTQGGFRVGSRRRQQPRHLALVTGTTAGARPQTFFQR
jgi:predicted sulfurtransferase